MILPPLPNGHRNGRLTILQFVRDPARPRHPRYRCRCDCGQIVFVQRANLERTHSCGCIKVEMLKAKATHGLSNAPEYRIWADMIARCTRVTRADFERYGAKGVTVCQTWLDSFEAFYADMGPRPSRKHSIDRIDNAKGYEPSNCRWATAKEQRINQRRQILHTHEGVTGTVKDLALHFGANPHSVHDRMWRLGWNIHDAITYGIQVERNSIRS